MEPRLYKQKQKVVSLSLSRHVLLTQSFSNNAGPADIAVKKWFKQRLFEGMAHTAGTARPS